MDRLDIDALLIGALYGELTPADEARLTAHLESHPGDRGALDDLKVARAAVRESRIFELQAEPPQAISALLLQEAHRRAPKRVVSSTGEEQESWFFRFTRVFMAHPAMAAAAMLVVVVGVFGVMRANKQDAAQVAEREYSPAEQLDKADETLKNEAAPTPAAEPLRWRWIPRKRRPTKAVIARTAIASVSTIRRAVATAPIAKRQRRRQASSSARSKRTRSPRV
jgi:hypothetical protein